MVTPTANVTRDRARGPLRQPYRLYRSTVVPRWLSVWGLLGIALSWAATLYSGFTQDFGFTTSSTALNATIGLQEMVLALWLIAKGFNWEPKLPATES